MKKILFVTTRNPYSKRFSGDVIGSKKIISTLKKNNLLDVISLDKKEDFSQRNLLLFKNPNFLLKIYYLIKSLIFFQPIHFALFYSREMKKYIDTKAQNYDLIFFYHIRSSQYLPKKFYGKKIIEIGDLYSNNYKQTFKSLSIVNPLKYIYFFESFLIKKVEKKIFAKFDKIILFSKNEIKKTDILFKKKIIHIDVSIDQNKKKYVFSKKNKKILFIGNLRYLPNILAVKSFIKEILPNLKKEIPNIKFEVIGEISSFNRFLFSLNRNVKFWGMQKKLDKFIKGSICGIANLEISTGIQGKVLSYMSYGLPVICSKNVAHNFERSVIVYKGYNDLKNNINKLKNDSKLSNNFSRKSSRFIKKFTWNKIQKEYLKIIRS